MLTEIMEIDISLFAIDVSFLLLVFPSTLPLISIEDLLFLSLEILILLILSFRGLFSADSSFVFDSFVFSSLFFGGFSLGSCVEMLFYLKSCLSISYCSPGKGLHCSCLDLGEAAVG